MPHLPPLTRTKRIGGCSSPGQLSAVSTRIDMVAGRQLAFDEESARAVRRRRADLPRVVLRGQALDRLEELLPGEGPLVDAVSSRFRCGLRHAGGPRSTAVFDAGYRSRAARSRAGTDRAAATASASPSSTSPTARGAATTGTRVRRLQPHPGEHRPARVHRPRRRPRRAHEGYPGHHLSTTPLLEQRARRRAGLGRVQRCTRSSRRMSLIAEGTANFGIEVALPGDGPRPAFERDVLDAARRAGSGAEADQLRTACDATRRSRSVICRQRGGAPLPRRRHRSRDDGRATGSTRYALMPRAARGAADAIHGRSTAAT